jgi:hypothetical protein
MSRFIRWLLNLFDNRTDWEKQREKETLEAIKQLCETHHIRVGKRGGVFSERKK